MPKGKGFVEFPVFEDRYEALKRATGGFRNVTADTVVPAVHETPISLVVLRCMLGFTPPDWAYYATRHTGVEITQSSARTLDRNIRINPDSTLPKRGTLIHRRVRALVTAACHALGAGIGEQHAETLYPDLRPQRDGEAGVPEPQANSLHRLDKADTRSGLVSVQSSAELGVPYPILLCERLLGRPFAGHRDSISELIGNIVGNAIEDLLSRAGISSRKTKRAEKLDGFDQAPDFVVPSDFNPQVVIEAKLTEDDGTARDKVTRIQHLATLSMQDQPPDQPRFEVIACIAGRGLGVWREDMKKLLLATRGKVFTLQDMCEFVSHTRLAEFRAR